MTGTVVKETEMKVSSGGIPYLTVKFANNHYYSKKDDKEVKKTNFMEFTLFGEMAKRFEDKIKKGMRIAVDGGLEVETTQVDGKWNTRVRLTVSYLALLAEEKIRGANSGKNSSQAERDSIDRERRRDKEEPVGDVEEESFDDIDSEFPF